jgi:formamidopyrimidine-DNA glycosylase
LPELPEVERTRRLLEPVMRGARITRVELRRPDLRAPFPPSFALRLRGQTVSALTRRGKYLLALLSSGDTLLMHLGMSGAFRVGPNELALAPGARPPLDPHDHVTFEMSTLATITFNDPRRFGSMDLVARGEVAAHPVLGRLGPEPLAPTFDAVALARACRGRRTSLKAALMDQRVVAGLGNIYVSEALHRARLSPRRRAATIATPTGMPRTSAVHLASAIKAVLRAAIARQEAYPPRTSRRPRFMVYDREGERCLRRDCGGTVKRITQVGRSTFYCPVCQK